MSESDEGTTDRAVRLRRMTAEYLRSMTPQQRDRTMQVHLAQARGPVANITLLRRMTGTMLRIKKTRKEEAGAGHD